MTPLSGCTQWHTTVVRKSPVVLAGRPGTVCARSESMNTQRLVLAFVALLVTGCGSSQDDSRGFFETNGTGGGSGDGEGQSNALERLFSTSEQEAAEADARANPAARTTLDVALVIDTTGSMSDEIAYLQSEFRDFAAAIDERHPSAEPRWSLVVYRDEGDSYVVQHEDFTADAEAFRTTLARQRADGGGDYPEAPERALARAQQLAWRTGSRTAKLVFWVADAPPHTENLLAFADSVRGLDDSAIAIYPVASSGVDESTEYYMRATAQLTGGRYIFITNDSGVGGDHKEPTISCYYVTLLRDALLRAIDAELLGAAALPTEDQVVRSVGEPDTDGVCQLENGTAHAF